MKTMFRKLIAMLLVTLTLVPMFATAAEAASSWPTLSSSKYCEFKATSQISVYRNSACTTRGTSSPAKSYNAYISKNDVCKILKITSSYIQLQYPTSSGYKTGYIKRNALFSVSAPSTVVTSQGRANVYAGPGYTSYGTIVKGDKVYVCGTSGSYTRVIYEAKSGSRAWKMGYVSTSTFKNTINPAPAPINTNTNTNTNTSTNWNAKVGTTVAKIKSGSSYGFYYNGTGNISARGGYYGQCTWYAYGRFYEVNNIALNSARHAKYWLSENAGDTRVKVVYGAENIAAKSIAVRTSGTYGHVMFIEHVTYNSNGTPAYVYFTECNNDGNGKYDTGKDCVVKKLSYSSFVNQKNPAGYILKK